ncbi:hypothetical protein L202_05279 [Cryptococcus amylolentus CBS 6039]|uniref:peptide chain release factor N(5)-glutamine methyltransferase n=2 Tax=Cryptococcus amylolentus TaxID=104669 RepID=A0A1E3HJW8_9TREE|nr:hypothetical protein L202_05279 [Cryptococcus amylolentus CBS 6039]ODN76632.1 hypothetical protein L202_05279 [Cryptococcus amylolentus CBS 6039]ODO04602.1 hypothetical protein I350_05208 [Cryptococcus amylolentus CBS 6273]
MLASKTLLRPTRLPLHPRFARPFTSTLSPLSSQPNHLQTLLQNRELQQSDAENELRWITSWVREEAKGMMKKRKLPPVEDERIGGFVQRRAEGEPLQYILGSIDFGPLTIKCKKPVLIPRPETAHIFTLLSSSILSSVPSLTSRDRPSSPLTVLDLCTGSGCVGLLMAHENLMAEVTGVDNSPAAVALAGANVRDNELGERVDIRYGNVFGLPQGLLGGKGKVGVVVSNPPYIPLHEWEQLPKGVREYESPAALLGDGKKAGEGLAFYERIAEILPELLQSEEEMEGKGWKGIPRVAVEVGLGQARKVEEIFKKSEVVGRTEVWKDQYGVERMVVGWS